MGTKTTRTTIKYKRVQGKVKFVRNVTTPNEDSELKATSIYNSNTTNAWLSQKVLKEALGSTNLDIDFSQREKTLSVKTKCSRHAIYKEGIGGRAKHSRCCRESNT